MQPEKLLTIQDVADQLQVGRHKASQYMRLMPCVALPGSRNRRVRQCDFQAWLSQNLIIPGEKPARRKPTSQPLDTQLFEPDGRLKRR